MLSLGPNLQTAYNAGHYKAMTEPEVAKRRPYWQYQTAGDGNVRPAHAAMETGYTDGMTLYGTSGIRPTGSGAGAWWYP